MTQCILTHTHTYTHHPGGPWGSGACLVTAAGSSTDGARVYQANLVQVRADALRTARGIFEI
jgi:hypothetical protein